jgi:hypothetical protein
LVRAHIDRQGGGFLIAIAGVLVIIALSFFAAFALRQGGRTLGIGSGQRVQLERIDSALADFVAQHRRLPCPARGNIASGALNAGVEAINLGTGQCMPANQSDGVVPWSTLGLSDSAALDAWNGRISYRVQPSLASNLLRLMNMSWCSLPGATNGAPGPSNSCAPAPCAGLACMHPSNYLYGKGVQVRDASGAWLNQAAPAWAGLPVPPPPSSGAAYVLVSHGANGAGAYGPSGALQAGSPAPGNQELANRNGLALTGTTVFIDTAPVATVGVTYFDDVLSHPTLATVLERARLGPRSH